MPIQIGRPPDHNFSEPLGLLSDCHRRIEYFLGVLIAATGRTPGGLLTPAQCAELEAALAYFATASPKHTADEEDSLFPRLRDTHDPAAKRAITLVEQLERDHVLPAAALSVYAGSDHRLRAIESGFQEHLVKPVEPALLAVTLARLVRRG